MIKSYTEKSIWSEEDIKTIERIVCILDGIRYYNTVDNKQEKPYQSEIDWLKTRFKSLRPQTTWKPSKEQMYWLKNAIDSLDTISVRPSRQNLESLYNDLKKLMEE